MSKRGESKYYNWVHDPFSEELPYIRSGEKREKLKKADREYKRKHNEKKTNIRKG